MAVLHASREREIAIKTSKLIAVGLVALAMLTFTGCIAGTLGITEMNQVYCQTVFFDNFEDGSATDGMPVTWSPSLLAEGTVDVVDGNYVAMGSDEKVGERMITNVTNIMFDAVSVEVRRLLLV